MRVLLDACLPQRLRFSILGHQVESARFAGVDGLLDDRMLRAIGGRFDVLVTVDSSMPHQQNLAGHPFAIIVLRAVSNRLPDLLPLVPALLQALEDVKPGEVREVGGDP